jgi:ribosome maturation factor RimP
LATSERIAQLQEFVESRLVDMGFELVDIRLSGAYGREVLELYCDRLDDGSICVDDCANISQQMKYMLNAEGFFGDDFSLVVSSPGLDRIVKKPEDFKRFAGRRIKVFLRSSDGGGSIEGQLLGYDGGRVKLALGNGEELLIEPDKYKLIRLVPEIEFHAGSSKKRKRGKKS